MTKRDLWKRLGRHLPWVREHEVLVQATRRAIEESETFRREIVSKLIARLPELKQTKVS